MQENSQGILQSPPTRLATPGTLSRHRADMHPTHGSLVYQDGRVQFIEKITGNVTFDSPIQEIHPKLFTAAGTPTALIIKSDADKHFHGFVPTIDPTLERSIILSLTEASASRVALSGRGAGFMPFEASKLGAVDNQIDQEAQALREATHPVFEAWTKLFQAHGIQVKNAQTLQPGTSQKYMKRYTLVIFAILIIGSLILGVVSSWF